MSITKVEFQNKKPHLRYDPDSKRYVGYRVDVRSRGKRFRPTFRTKGEAERFVDDLRARKVHQKAGLKYAPRSEVMLKQLFEARLRQLTNPKEVVRARRVFGLFESIFDYPPKVAGVTTADIQLYINERLATGVTPQTVDREVTILASAIYQATVLFPRDLEDFDPPKIARPKYKKRKRKKRIISEAEKDLIVASILSDRLPRENVARTVNRPVIARIFEMGWFLGFRLSEVLKLQKSDYNEADRSLRVRRWKTDTISTIGYLPDRVVAILTESAAESSSDLVFDLTCSEHTFTDTIARACQANDIPYGRSNLDGVTFHTTRHSFTSRLTKVTDIATAGDFTGHSSEVMVDYYSQPTEESKRLAMERMYGNGRRESMMRIFEKVRSGDMDLEEFLRVVNLGVFH